MSVTQPRDKIGRYGFWSFMIFLVIALGGVIATAFAVIGLLRGRCRWYAAVMYLFCIAIGFFLFRGVLWISEKIAQPDRTPKVFS